MNEVDQIMNCPNLNTEGSIVVKDWLELTRMSKEFFVNAPTMNLAELDNAFKCFGLAYLSFKFPDTMIGNMHRNVSGPIIFRLIGSAHLDRMFELQRVDAT